MRSERRLLHRNLGAVAGLTRDMAGSALFFCLKVSAGLAIESEPNLLIT